MPRPKRGRRLGGSATHQRHILSNLAKELFWDEKVTTTVAKAKMLRPYAEKMISKARNGSLHDRRTVLAHIEDTQVVTRLFARVATRPGESEGAMIEEARKVPPSMLTLGVAMLMGFIVIAIATIVS